MPRAPLRLGSARPAAGAERRRCRRLAPWRQTNAVPAAPNPLNLTGLALTPGAQRSWWLREALGQEPGQPCPPLEADVKTDVVIVGGGFTGLWTAYFLIERNPDLGVVVLEQDICGGGPSGRNRGFPRPRWGRLRGPVTLYGPEAGGNARPAISSRIGATGEFFGPPPIHTWDLRGGD